MRRRLLLLAGLAVSAGLGCGPSGVTGDVGDGGIDGATVKVPDGSPMDKIDGSRRPVDAGGPNLDAFFAKDPPPQYCGPPDGGVTLPEIGGTPDCPSDKNREGCPCSKPGEPAPCWPGLRVDRNRGICKDGVTKCEDVDDVQARWGPCVGYVLPMEGATNGAQACNCFSAGTWEIDNLSPCFITYGSSDTYAVSTYLDSDGKAKCPTQNSNTPPPKPSGVFSPNRLKVDCAGQFALCYTLKAGKENDPKPTDCVLAKTCTEAWYPEANKIQELPPLPGWTSADKACASAFMTTGGYGEMSVVGKSVECDVIAQESEPYVFHRIGYCPLKCTEQPSLPECANCGNGASGGF